MGGGLTVRILSEGEPLLSGFGELILEPQSDIDRVRAWLLEHGFFLAQENFVEEDGKYYPILRAVPWGKGESEGGGAFLWTAPSGKGKSSAEGIPSETAGAEPER